jgi:hypothetical protein
MNEPSLKNVRAQGFEPWMPMASVFSSCPSCPRPHPARPCCCDYFYLPTRAQRTAVAALLAGYAGSQLTLGRAGNQLVLDVECKLLRDAGYRQSAADFADGATW